MSIFSTLATHVVTVSVSIFLWPFLFIIGGLNELCRLVVSRSLPKSFELIEECCGNIVWGDMLNTRMVVVALFSNQETVNISKYQKRLMEGLINKRGATKRMLFENLRKVHVKKFGYACLKHEPNSFKIENHVKLFDASTPANGNYFSEQELTNRILPDYLSKNMDESKPQWEFLVFPIVKRNNGRMDTLRIFRFDHRYMDGASAGVVLAEGIFDQWEGGLPPYIFNPNLPLPNQSAYWMVLAKVWAFLHLPLIVLLSLLPLIFPPEKSEKKPFVAWNTKDRGVFTSVHSMTTSKMKSLGNKKRRNYNFKAGLLTLLGPVLGKVWNSILKLEKDEVFTVTAATCDALLPYSPGLHNQFTIRQASLVLLPNSGEKEEIVDFPMDMTFLFAYAHIMWTGRLPIWAINALAVPAEATVLLNSVPFLRKEGSICGTKITEMASWDSLYPPIGLVITVLGYGGKMFISAFSVEGCLTQDEINDILSNYISQMQA